jgi:hypothetical protein
MQRLLRSSGRKLFASARVSTAFLVGFVASAGVFAGCGAEAEHPLTIVSYKDIGCNPMVDPECVQFYGCSDLGIKDLRIEVGVFHRALVTVPCPESLVSGSSETSAQINVPYERGQDFYMIDASFTREGSTINLIAGPFSEDEAATPWRLVLR